MPPRKAVTTLIKTPPNPVLSLPKLLWTPSPNYSGRNVPINLLVLHDCEGSYKGAVSWFAQHRSEVSAHVVLGEDGTEATQMVGYSHKAWHACNANGRSLGLEMGGTEARGFPEAEWTSAAHILAYWLHRYKIPARFAVNGVGAGFCRHLDLGVEGGGHKDPTLDNVQWGKFVGLVEHLYATCDMPATPWGRD